MTWSTEPGIVVPLAVTAVLYARGGWQLIGRSTYSTAALKRDMQFFVSGFVVLAIALLSPIHELGEELFSAHMIQHELLMAIAAPLLVVGNPAVPLLWGTPVRARSPIGHAFGSRPVQAIWSFITRPLVAFLAHAAAIWIWHAPRLYDASVTSELVHSAQHLSFLGTALLFWWSLFHSRQRKGSEGAAILYLFLTGIHTTLLGALLATSDSAIYSVYTDATTRVWGLTAIDDVQLGGIIMWVPGGLVYLGAALYLMLKWLKEAGERADARDALRRQATVTSVARGIAALALVILVSACNDHRDAEWAAEMTGGAPLRGKEAIRSYGCMSCHSIPGVAGANRLVGPPLDGIASRSYIAGVLSNTPDHMIEWLRNPPGIDSKTAMPNMHVTERDARDIAAYLYTLR